MHLPRLVPIVALAVLALLPGASARPGERPSATVRLVIDYGEGVQKHFTSIPHRPDMTVEQAMNTARAFAPPRGLAYESKGSGERAFLISIDGLANEGAGRGRRNWLYFVNDTPGDRSFALAKLEPGDTAAWRFTTNDRAGQGE